MNGNSIIEFGKYKGKTLDQIKELDCIYLDWALKNITWFRESLDRTYYEELYQWIRWDQEENYPDAYSLYFQ
jgi:hypothetical protein